jgi:23S rRNA (cytosine1962-C5)-methyltransferase
MVHGEADGLPGATVDWFNSVAVVSFYQGWTGRTERLLVDCIADQLRPRAVYLKRRPREARTALLREAKSLAPDQPVFGAQVPEVVVAEGGLKYLIRPPNGLSVGLYLDARDCRHWVRGHAAKKRVLNCFAYTCAFGVSAHAGGAESVVNVDLSRRALEWGQQNAQFNGQPVAPQGHLCGDVFDWLRRFRKQGRLFDLAILDPPSFATARHKTFSAAQDWPRLVAEASHAIAGGGLLVACCNQASLSAQRFERLLRRGFQGVARRAPQIERLGASPVDFPSAPGKPDALKVLCYRLD